MPGLGPGPLTETPGQKGQDHEHSVAGTRRTMIKAELQILHLCFIFSLDIPWGWDVKILINNKQMQKA